LDSHAIAEAMADKRCWLRIVKWLRAFFMLRPVKGWETNHSQMTTSFFMLQRLKIDAG